MTDMVTPNGEDMKSDALKDTQVKKAKPRDKQYKLTDGKGLFIIIRPNGSKWWRFKYRFADKHREISFGVVFPLWRVFHEVRSCTTKRYFILPLKV